MSTRASALSSFKGSSPALDRRGWNLALAFQEVFTAIVRLRYNRQAVSNAESFRAQIKQALRVAEQEARSGGCSAEDVKQAVFALVAFLDESALSCRNPAFADWARLPLQAEMFGHQLAGEVFFQELQKTLSSQRLCGNCRPAGGLLPVPAAWIQGPLCRRRGPSRHHGWDSGKDLAGSRPFWRAVAAWRYPRRRRSPGTVGPLGSPAGARFSCGLPRSAGHFRGSKSSIDFRHL